MAVLKSKRKVSRLEFLHNAYAIQRTIVLLLLRDFGVKAKVRTVRAFSTIYKMTDEDKERLLEIMDRYGITSISEEYPEWLIADMRDRILREARGLIRNIIQANSIFPHTRGEYEDRRRYQTMAIGNCEQLIQELQYIISIISVDANKYLPYVDMIDREVALLRGWRKSDNRLLAKIKEAERQEAAEEIIAAEELAKKLKEERANREQTLSSEINNAKGDLPETMNGQQMINGDKNSITNSETDSSPGITPESDLSYDTASRSTEIIRGSISKLPLEVLEMGVDTLN